ncbi:DUF6285 domain-containing protein [Sphingomonas naphthae]|uniref:DUF6285 domain-containing protein n=1 Tax=Sphingomonas naphthae TaxID=1813468 RepID=A0ABY7TH88_9SPHN|nr:DUF6285 domain-containing protein [Sphingomonas naphthae]WCT72176.1 DUF6285 domain-containing protein [Sphingomonas naphthae]
MSRTSPTASELVAVIATFLRDMAGSQLAGAGRYHALVAANSLDLVGREIAQGPNVDRAATERVRPLLGAEGNISALDAMLCDRIAGGGIAIDDPALLEHLLLTAEAEIGIDQPGYATLRLLQAQRRSNEGE